mgnify:CR=1 FL=1
MYRIAKQLTKGDIVSYRDHNDDTHKKGVFISFFTRPVWVRGVEYPNASVYFTLISEQGTTITRQWIKTTETKQ